MNGIFKKRIDNRYISSTFALNITIQVVKTNLIFNTVSLKMFLSKTFFFYSFFIAVIGLHASSVDAKPYINRVNPHNESKFLLFNICYNQYIYRT